MMLCSMPRVGSCTKNLAEELARAFEAPALGHVHLPLSYHTSSDIAHKVDFRQSARTWTIHCVYAGFL